MGGIYMANSLRMARITAGPMEKKLGWRFGPGDRNPSKKRRAVCSTGGSYTDIFL
jgi:hypothetical protein